MYLYHNFLRKSKNLNSNNVMQIYMHDTCSNDVNGIRSELEKGDVVLFLGSGFSASLHYHTFFGLTEILAKNLSPDAKDLEGNTLQEVVESLEKGLDRSKIVNFIRQLYPAPKDFGTDNPYFILKTLLDNLKGRILIFTTNIDMENNYVFKDQAEIISTENQLIEMKELPTITIFELHGDIGNENVKQSLVLTHEDAGKSIA